jgi:hypothetical protein
MRQFQGLSVLGGAGSTTVPFASHLFRLNVGSGAVVFPAAAAPIPDFEVRSPRRTEPASKDRVGPSWPANAGLSLAGQARPTLQKLWKGKDHGLLF